ncbi:MAG: TRAP transporter small permease subunit [Gammaproteobacteria bacterium]|nr:TRAP transporter small permease subunit [Gammaproteobacteria bacterium]
MMWLGKINDAVGRVMAWLVLVLTVIVFYDVCMRFLFRAGSPALQELEWHLFALIFLLGAAATYKVQGHVRVEVLYQNLSPRTQTIINTLGDMFILLPVCVVIIKTSIPFVEAAWSYDESSPDPGGLSYRWLIKAAIPAGFFLLAFQAIVNIVSNLSMLIRDREN